MVAALWTRTATANKRLTYAYNAAGQRTFMRDDALHTYDYKYLPDGHLLEILNAYGQRFTFGYDPVGRMTERRLANGVTIERTFDAAGREVLRVNTKRDGTALGIYTASYDPVGNRLTVQEFDGTRVTHEYDALYRLVTDQRDGTYSFNRTYTYL
jgi:YD repeat-containing protein